MSQDYLASGFDSFMDRSIGSASQNAVIETLENVSSVMSSGDINFDTSQISGSLGDKIQVGGSNVIIDGGGSRIIINDGTNDRVLIGKDEGGF